MEKSQVKTESFKLSFAELTFLKELGILPQVDKPEELFATVKSLAQKYECEISST